MHRAALFLALCVSACSSESTNPGPSTTTDASTTSDTSAAADSGTDVTSPTGDAKACPSSAPDDQAPCDSPGQLCEYPIDCGPQAGSFATCTNTKWNVVKRPCTTGDTGAAG